MRRVVLLALMAVALLAAVTACGQTKADIAAHNISKRAEEFQVARRIVAVNGITDKYLLEVKGYCSIETANSGLAGAAAITCRVGNGYKKSYVYLSDNVTFVVQQINPVDVSTSHYEFIFRPSTIVPDIEVK